MHFASSKVYTPLPRSNSKPTLPNTNIISIDLGVLAHQVKLFTGDPKVCRNCEAIFNSISEITVEGENKIWKCEFCGNVNLIDLEDEEIPTKEEIFDYMLFPPEEKNFSGEDKVIIFCLDISGSMCVTTEILGNLKFRGDKNPGLWKSLHNKDAAIDQFLPGQRRDVTYISRLQCVQAAIDFQLEKLKNEHPNYKVGLIVFNNEVTILGDGTNQPVVITGDKLNDYDTLYNIGTTLPVVKPIGLCKDQLSKKLYELDECGATALGPALVVSLGMSQSYPGSTIVLATDGLANTGVGSLDPPTIIPTSTLFYDHLTQNAKEKSISVNILGIRGDSINVNVMGKISDGTSGMIDLVDPEKITDNFSTILESRLVGTNVSVKLFLHSGFLFPEEEEWKKGDEFKFYVMRNVGNAFEDTEITAEFKLKSTEEISKIFSEKSNSKKELPFQVQIEYTAISGMKCLRVITRKREITTDQSEVIRNVDVALLGMHANLTSAKKAHRGDVLGAMKSMESYGILIETNVKTKEERQSFNMWNYNNNQLYSSPHIKAQQKIQEQYPLGNPVSMPPYTHYQPPPTPLTGTKNQSFVSETPKSPPVRFAFSSHVAEPSLLPSTSSTSSTSQKQNQNSNSLDFILNSTQSQPTPLTTYPSFGSIPPSPGLSHPPQPQPSSPQSPLSPGFSFQPQPPLPQSPLSPGFSFQPQPYLPPPQSPLSPGFSSQPQPYLPPQSPLSSGFSFQPQPTPQSPLSSGFSFQPQPQPQSPLSPPGLSYQHQPQLSPQSPPGFPFQPQPYLPLPQSSLSPFQPQSSSPQFLSPPGLSSQPQPYLPPPQSPQYDDDTSNQIYHQMNVRNNRNLWSEKRKF